MTVIREDDLIDSVADALQFIPTTTPSTLYNRFIKPMKWSLILQRRMQWLRS